MQMRLACYRQRQNCDVQMRNTRLPRETAHSPVVRNQKDACVTEKYIVGIDEAGCGALAGPLIVAAVAFKVDAARVSAPWRSARGRDKVLMAGDSKGIKDPQQRAVLAAAIYKQSDVPVIIKRTPGEIDARLFHVVFPETVRLVAARCIERLQLLDPTLLSSDVLVLIDGDIEKPNIPCPVQCIVDGDKTDWRIGAASVIAKHAHDENVEALATRYPQWDFLAHRGYPTKAHKDMLMKRGPTSDHRRSFRPVMAASPRAQGIEE